MSLSNLSHHEGIQSSSFVVSLHGDKSITHRAFMFAAIAEGISIIDNVGGGEDLASTRHVLAQLGATFTQLDSGWRVIGVGGIDRLAPPQQVLNCGNSGTTMRLLAGLLSGCQTTVILDGDASLRRRPMRRIAKVLTPLGRGLDTAEHGGAPIRVGGSLNLENTQKHTEPVVIDTQSSSAQLKSAALLAGLSAKYPVIVNEQALSRDHTERMLAALLGRTPSNISAPLSTPLPAFTLHSPGDPSSAAFWVAVAALSPHWAPSIFLKGVNLNPTRLGLFRIAQRMGMKISMEVNETRLGEPVGDIIIQTLPKGQRLQAITIRGRDSLDALDELPIVALLGSLAFGTTVVSDAAELRVKESNRLDAMTVGLSRLGAQIKTLDDGWSIQGINSFTTDQPIEVDSKGDHRIAMCLLIAQLACPPAHVTVHGLDCIAVSYPEFINLLRSYQTETERNHPSESD